MQRAVEGFAEFRLPDDLGGAVVAGVQHVRLQIADEAAERELVEQRGGAGSVDRLVRQVERRVSGGGFGAHRQQFRLHHRAFRPGTNGVVELGAGGVQRDLHFADAQLGDAVAGLALLAQVINGPGVQPFRRAEVVGGETEMETALPAPIGVSPRRAQQMAVGNEDVVEGQQRAAGGAHAVGLIPRIIPYLPVHAGFENHHLVVVDVAFHPVQRDEGNHGVGDRPVGDIVLDAVDHQTARHPLGLGFHLVHVGAARLAADRREQPETRRHRFEEAVDLFGRADAFQNPGGVVVNLKAMGGGAVAVTDGADQVDRLQVEALRDAKPSSTK